MQDTLAIDTLAGLYPALDTAAIADWAAAEAAARAQHTADSLALLPPAWHSGMEPRALPKGTSTDSGLSALLVGMLVVVTLSLKHCRHLLASLFKDLWSIRNRNNEYDEHTSNETLLMCLFGVQLSVYLGLMLEAAAGLHARMMPFAQSFGTTMLFVTLAGGLYAFHLCAYCAVGYAFTTADNTRQWLRGFNAGQALLGFVMAVPAIVAVFYPGAAVFTVVLAASLYILSRIIFIIKGFRIFYTDFGSILYFILYLCALEIVPIVLILAASYAII